MKHVWLVQDNYAPTDVYAFTSKKKAEEFIKRVHDYEGTEELPEDEITDQFSVLKTKLN